MMQLLTAVRNKYKHACFLIGNGPNLAAGLFPSWKELLVAASGEPIRFTSEGLTNTEVYDLIQVYVNDDKKVKRRVCEKLLCPPPEKLGLHKRLMELARFTGSPVLTTNFDAAFETAAGARKFHIDTRGFTAIYPWKTYYGFEKLASPRDGFAIWKIHGDVNYKQSIRLGLTDYMGNAQRARAYIHQGAGRLFRDRIDAAWNGSQTWLDIWFHLPVIIFGFGFTTDETFLRWLMIERRRYKQSLGLPMEVVYLSLMSPAPATKNLLANLDIEFIHFNKYEDLYGGLS